MRHWRKRERERRGERCDVGSRQRALSGEQRLERPRERERRLEWVQASSGTAGEEDPNPLISCRVRIELSGRVKIVCLI